MCNRNAKKQINFFVLSRGAPPRKDTTHCIQKPETMNVACFRVAMFRPATRWHDKFHVKARQLKCGVVSCGGSKGRHAITRQSVNLSCLRVAGFRLAMQRHDKLQGKTRQIKCGVFSCGGAKGRHAKTRQSNNFRPATRQKYHRVVVPSPRKHAHTTWHKSATIFRRSYSWHKLQAAFGRSVGP